MDQGKLELLLDIQLEMRLQRRQCTHACPHGLCVYIFNVELPTFRCLSWELSHCLISGSLSP